MSKIIFACVDDLFKSYDYNNIPIKKSILKDHNKKDNAWVSINDTVYSIRKDDELLLELFKNYYGKKISDKKFTKKNLFLNLKDKILFFERLNKRKIGYLID
jgi:cytochrome b involved in lipid metabolism